MKTKIVHSRSGFTLVELLVVVAIIIVLAALTVMGFSRMRAAGDRATTVSVLRQLQTANASYASEELPAAGGLSSAATRST